VTNNRFSKHTMNTMSMGHSAHSWVSLANITTVSSLCTSFIPFCCSTYRCLHTWINLSNFLNLTQIFALEKICPSVEQNRIDIYLPLIVVWKIFWKTNLLDAWTVCFQNRNTPEFARFLNEINIFASLYQIYDVLV
jgi:hypothetical protein